MVFVITNFYLHANSSSRMLFSILLFDIATSFGTDVLYDSLNHFKKRLIFVPSEVFGTLPGPFQGRGHYHIVGKGNKNVFHSFRVFTIY